MVVNYNRNRNKNHNVTTKIIHGFCLAVFLRLLFYLLCFAFPNMDGNRNRKPQTKYHCKPKNWHNNRDRIRMIPRTSRNVFISCKFSE